MCVQEHGPVVAVPAADDDARPEEGRAGDAEKPDTVEEQNEAAGSEEKAAAAADDKATPMDVDTEAGTSTVRHTSAFLLSHPMSRVVIILAFQHPRSTYILTFSCCCSVPAHM
jgi:hypothetical protein